MIFQSENVVFKLPRRSVDGPSTRKIRQHEQQVRDGVAEWFTSLDLKFGGLNLVQILHPIASWIFSP